MIQIRFFLTAMLIAQSITTNCMQEIVNNKKSKKPNLTIQIPSIEKSKNAVPLAADTIAKSSEISVSEENKNNPAKVFKNTYAGTKIKQKIVSKEEIAAKKRNMGSHRSYVLSLNGLIKLVDPNNLFAAPKNRPVENSASQTQTLPETRSQHRERFTIEFLGAAPSPVQNQEDNMSAGASA